MKIIIVVLMLFAFPAIVIGHPGNIDDNGGHFVSKTGEYHYHKGRTNSGIHYSDDTNSKKSSNYESIQPLDLSKLQKPKAKYNIGTLKTGTKPIKSLIGDTIEWDNGSKWTDVHVLQISKKNGQFGVLINTSSATEPSTVKPGWYSGFKNIMFAKAKTENSDTAFKTNTLPDQPINQKQSKKIKRSKNVISQEDTVATIDYLVQKTTSSEELDHIMLLSENASLKMYVPMRETAEMIIAIKSKDEMNLLDTYIDELIDVRKPAEIIQLIYSWQKINNGKEISLEILKQSKILSLKKGISIKQATEQLLKTKE